MKNIYKISKGQLVSIWIFGIIGFFVSLGESDYSGFATFLSIIIPAVLFFYTIGWENANKKEKIAGNFKIKNLLPSKRNIIIILLVLLFIIIAIFSIILLVKLNNNKKLEKQYNESISKVDNLKQEVSDCIKPAIDKKFQEELRDCNILKNKIKSDYNFCISLDLTESPASCLYKNDYEKIDCSEEMIYKKAYSKITSNDLTDSCSSLVDELKETNLIINSYKQ